MANQSKVTRNAPFKFFALCVAVLIVFSFAVFWFYQFAFLANRHSSNNENVANNSSAVPSSTADLTSEAIVEQQLESINASTPESNPTLTEPLISTQEYSAASVLSLDWGGSLSDEQFADVVLQLKTDTSLLDQFLDKFRQETDPARRQLLALILAKVGGDEVILAASELVFSGDEKSRSLGLKMLQNVQLVNPQVHNIVSGMLATEVQPQVLKDTLSVLATPGSVDSQSRAYLADQVALLTTHNNAGVRSVSLDILSRWSVDGSYTDVLLMGLDDGSATVRTSAAYALVDHEDQSPLVVDGLFDIVRDPGESKTVKRAAKLALRSMPLSQQQAQELDVFEKQLNTRSR
jgi:hypothetical protein